MTRSSGSNGGPAYLSPSFPQRCHLTKLSTLTTRMSTPVNSGQGTAGHPVTRSVLHTAPLGAPGTVAGRTASRPSGRRVLLLKRPGCASRAAAQRFPSVCPSRWFSSRRKGPGDTARTAGRLLWGLGERTPLPGPP